MCEVGYMFNEGSEVFVKISNIVRNWNTHNFIEMSLSRLVGKVYAIVVGFHTFNCCAWDLVGYA